MAKAFADKYQGLREAHAEVCKNGFLSPGGIHLVYLVPYELKLPTLIFAATKDHWRDPSQSQWVASIMDRIVERLEDRASFPPNLPVSCAIPALGAGCGGLDQHEMIQLIIDKISVESPVTWEIHIPWVMPATRRK